MRSIATPPEEIAIQIARLTRWPLTLTRLDCCERGGEYTISWKSWDESEHGRILRTLSRERYFQAVSVILAIRSGKLRKHQHKSAIASIMAEPKTPRPIKLVRRKPVKREDRRQQYFAETGRL